METKRYTKKQIQDEFYEINKISTEKKHSFAENLKNIRQIYKISQRDVSSYFGIPEKTYSAWERGKREPPIYFQYLLLNEIDRVFRKHGNILNALIAGSSITIDEALDNIPF